MNDYLRDAWKYYEYGRLYNNNLTPNQYTMVNTNNEFFIGNQWIHMPDNEAMRRLAKPTFNIIKRVTSLFVASLTSSNTTISFEPLSYQNDGEAASFAASGMHCLTGPLRGIMQHTSSGTRKQGLTAVPLENTRVRLRWS